MTLHRISVADLSKATGEPAKTIQEWIGKGRTPRSLDAIPKIAALFKVSTHRVLFGEEDPRLSIGELLEKSELHTGLYEITIKKVTKGSN